MGKAAKVPKIAIIVPAYNEEKQIAGVLSVLKQVKDIDEIIVVNDGSTDDTSLIARNFGAKVIDLKSNIGKGGAIYKGAKETDADIVVFIDADLIGLKPTHVNSLIKPILDGIADMAVGIFTSGRFRTDISQKMFPFISGQRAIKRSFIESMEDLELSRYGIEIAITKYAKEMGLATSAVPLEDLTHVMKEEKLGYPKGFLARLHMYREMLVYFFIRTKSRFGNRV